MISRNYKPRKPDLNFFQANQVVIWVAFNNLSTTKEIMNYISEKFGVNYCIKTVRQLLVKRGLKVILHREVPGNPPVRRRTTRIHRTSSKNKGKFGARNQILLRRCDAPYSLKYKRTMLGRFKISSDIGNQFEPETIEHTRCVRCRLLFVGSFNERRELRRGPRRRISRETR